MTIKPEIRYPRLKILWPLVILTALLLSACGELTPTNDAGATQLVINEVFTGAKAGGVQWFELLNNTDDLIKLDGYTLDTPHGTLDLAALAATSDYYQKNKGIPKGGLLVFSNYPKTINDQMFKLTFDNAKDATDADKTAKAALKPPPLGVEDRAVLGKLNPDSDVIVLKQNGGVIDQLGWGNPDANAIKSLGIIKTDINLNLPAAKSDNDSLGRTAHFNQRPAKDGPDGKPVPDPGHINPGVFTVHNTPTPGANTTPRAKVTTDFFFGSFTDLITTLGSLLLWMTFVFIALVARRFETLSEQKTYWQYLAVAPVGILIYAVIQVQDFIRTGSLSDFWSWPAFLALFISGAACVYVVNIFRLIAKNILQAE